MGRRREGVGLLRLAVAAVRLVSMWGCVGGEVGVVEGDVAGEAMRGFAITLVGELFVDFWLRLLEGECLFADHLVNEVAAVWVGDEF